MKNKLRVSYSLLSAWARGKPDQAVSIYFHLDQFKTKPMEDGKRIHKEIAKIVGQTGQFPEWLSAIKLNQPLTEQEVIADYNELFTVKSIFDCRDEKTLYEFKTGGADSLEWAREMQVPFYFLVAELAGKPLEKAYLIHYNQHNQTSDWTLIWNNKGLRNEARNFIDSLAPEVYDHFLKEGLI